MNKYEELDKEFKKLTGLSLNCGPDEWEEWYHKQLAVEAKESPLTREILKVAEQIIENKQYSQLFKILENYDHMMKESLGISTEFRKPYWCYCLCSLGK